MEDRTETFEEEEEKREGTRSQLERTDGFKNERRFEENKDQKQRI